MWLALGTRTMLVAQPSAKSFDSGIDPGAGVSAGKIFSDVHVKVSDIQDRMDTLESKLDMIIAAVSFTSKRNVAFVILSDTPSAKVSHAVSS
jgi:hypothetical protein